MIYPAIAMQASVILQRLTLQLRMLSHRHYHHLLHQMVLLLYQQLLKSDVSSNIVLTFSENIAAGTGNIVISDGASDTRTIPVGDAQISISGATSLLTRLLI